MTAWMRRPKRLLSDLSVASWWTKEETLKCWECGVNISSVVEMDTVAHKKHCRFYCCTEAEMAQRKGSTGYLPQLFRRSSSARSAETGSTSCSEAVELFEEEEDCGSMTWESREHSSSHGVSREHSSLHGVDSTAGVDSNCGSKHVQEVSPSVAAGALAHRPQLQLFFIETVQKDVALPSTHPESEFGKAVDLSKYAGRSVEGIMYPSDNVKKSKDKKKRKEGALRDAARGNLWAVPSPNLPRIVVQQS
mmetsp:Transcript_26013/g.60118  ORF Transcript_26013/g.60118 Transcript_26013/m.60118 type:complete len:249 (+) Transcript_26013:70-816(+)